MADISHMLIQIFSDFHHDNHNLIIPIDTAVEEYSTWPDSINRLSIGQIQNVNSEWVSPRDPQLNYIH